MADSARGKYLSSIITGLVLIVGFVIWFGLTQTKLKQAPDIVLQLTDGRKFNLSGSLEGPLLVTFWATSCSTCIKKTPELKALYQKLKPQGFELIAVAMSYDPPNRILAFAEDYEIPYPIALDLDGSVAAAFDDVSSTPTTFLISAEKKIVSTVIGDLDIRTMEKTISNMLEQAVSTTFKEAA